MYQYLLGLQWLLYVIGFSIQCSSMYAIFRLGKQSYITAKDAAALGRNIPDCAGDSDAWSRWHANIGKLLEQYEQDSEAWGRGFKRYIGRYFLGVALVVAAGFILH